MDHLSFFLPVSFMMSCIVWIGGRCPAFQSQCLTLRFYIIISSTASQLHCLPEAYTGHELHPHCSTHRPCPYLVHSHLLCLNLEKWSEAFWLGCMWVRVWEFLCNWYYMHFADQQVRDEIWRESKQLAMYEYTVCKQLITIIANTYECGCYTDVTYCVLKDV